MPPTYEASKRGYANMWRTATLQPAKEASVIRTARKFFPDHVKYQAVEKLTGVPAWWIFCVHIRESGGDFRGVLHNGEHIIGTGRQTRLVPAGRGPFSTWEQAAVDALRIKGLDKITDWNISRALYEWERFNGFGYTSKGINSPYVWADTSHEQLGKYVSDGKFDRTVDDTQVGCAALLKALCKLDSSIDAKVNTHIVPAAPPPPPDIDPPKRPKPPKPPKPEVKPPVTDVLKSKTVWSSIGAFFTSVLATISDHRVQIVLLLIAAGFAGYIIYSRRKKQTEFGV